MVTEAGQRLVAQQPRIRLLSFFADPFDLSMAAARTCYMPRVVETSEITDRQRESISRATYGGGHHTVYQHAHFVFGMENISRQFVWSYLHSHPFYNSEQSSQRFVRLDKVQAFIPPVEGEARAVYDGAIVRAWEHYRRLTDILERDTWTIMAELRHFDEMHGGEKRRKRIEREAEKKAIETARYVIPIAAHTSMIHTISGITLHRLRRMQQANDVPHEAGVVIDEMVRAVRDIDPMFFDKIGEPPLERQALPEFGFPGVRQDAESFCEDFDRKLAGKTAKLVDYSKDAEELVADALRAVLGLSKAELTTEEALRRLLDPHVNSLRTDTLNVAVHSPMMRALFHANYVFMKKISHTADSQDQRHRMVPGSRPLMTQTDTRASDYIVPMLIRRNPEAESIYREAMEEAWNAKNRLLQLGVPLEWALYVLPNAKALRFVESGSLIYLIHKWTMRTCFNAQEEIYEASMDELDQVRRAHPHIASYMGPPCVVRNGVVSPRCTEGDRFCGVSVWQSFPHVERRI
ncbi:MAG TPA: FAD-dependent thymidylate synthase [Vicinamibacteria bacterium]|jgi:thymidylate synthase ThyX